VSFVLRLDFVVVLKHFSYRGYGGNGVGVRW
jgi:hypothetical protein